MAGTVLGHTTKALCPWNFSAVIGDIEFRLAFLAATYNSCPARDKLQMTTAGQGASTMGQEQAELVGTGLPPGRTVVESAQIGGYIL